MDRRWGWVLLGAVAAVVLGGVGAAAFVYSGVYPIAANEPHTAPVAWLLTTVQEQSVSVRADEDMPTPDLRDPDLLAGGAVLYHQHCVVCHGAPGVERAILGRGLNPDPPRLATEIRDWTDAELYWIVAHGLKMAGMPAFQPGLADREVWATVAFMRALPAITPGAYARAVQSPDTVRFPLLDESAAVPVTPVSGGDPVRGRQLVAGFGCGSCHVIPGVASARGQVGPPLDDYALRHDIAGNAINTPENLTRWLYSPESIEPGTAMPAVGATVEEASDMAAYLLTLGAGSLLGPRSVLPAEWLPRH
ncbi:MAG TPA: c-type cytochrome [Longimicrobiales bacterium]|nr:c-type cytochrome [Longimicrobiales bacterium]